MLKPYFLRRTKDLVLNLPPLVSRDNISLRNPLLTMSHRHAARGRCAGQHDRPAAPDLPWHSRTQRRRHPLNRPEIGDEHEWPRQAEEEQLQVRSFASLKWRAKLTRAPHSYEQQHPHGAAESSLPPVPR